MAVPHARVYYFGAQLQQLDGWGKVDSADPICKLLIPQGANMPALAFLEAGFPHLVQHRQSPYYARFGPILKTCWAYRGFTLDPTMAKFYQEVLKL